MLEYKTNCCIPSSVPPSRISLLLAVSTLVLLVASNHGMLLHGSEKKVWFQQRTRSGLPFKSYTDPNLLAENPFENRTNVNLTVPLGDTAFLRCKVKNLGERSISWIRRRDWHILTTGKTTYTNDERFHVLHGDGSDEWTLQIKFVQKRDNGTYECQVATGTGVVSLLVHLNIAVPEAFILGNGEYHVEQGSTINLVCVIEKSPKPPEYVFWYHNDRMINYGNSREVTVRTEPGIKTHSRLTIRDAHISDSGNYTCKTANAEPASIFVYVSQASGLFSGDKIAAIQRRKSSSSAPPLLLSQGLSIFFRLFLFLSSAFLSSPSPPSSSSLSLSSWVRTFLNACVLLALSVCVESYFFSRTIAFTSGLLFIAIAPFFCASVSTLT